MNIPQPHRRIVRELFFWSGIIATITYRMVVFFNGRSVLWVDILWYTGTIGFIIYFAHRYQVSETRSKVLAEHHLAQKIEAVHDLSRDDKQAMDYIFKTLESSKEKINYIVIFVSSGLALLLNIYLDFFMKK